MRQFNPLTKTGFTLIEALVAGAILGISIVILFHTFSISIRSIRTAQDYMRGKFLLQKKMALLEIGGIPEVVEGNFDPPFSNFSWELKVEEKEIIKNVELDKVSVKVILPERSDNRIIKAITYLK